MIDIAETIRHDVEVVRAGPGDGQRKRLESGLSITTAHKSPPGVQVESLIQCAPRRIHDILTDYERMPEFIYALTEARVLGREAGHAEVEFTMKLPFPVGTVTWRNAIATRCIDGVYAIAWSLTSGDLRANSGRLVMAHHDGHPERTYARYQVSVETRARLPRSAQRLATRWLLPKVMDRLIAEAES